MKSMVVNSHSELWNPFAINTPKLRITRMMKGTDYPGFSLPLKSDRANSMPPTPSAIPASQKTAIIAIRITQSQPDGSLTPEAIPETTANPWLTSSRPTEAPKLQAIHFTNDRARSAAHRSNPPPTSMTGNNSIGSRKSK